MRPLRRFLIFGEELGIILLGSIFSLVVAVTLAMSLVISGDIALLVFLAGCLLTIAGFAALRRKHRAWKIEYDAAGWMIINAERKLHPIRAKYKRIVKRILLWVPSATAALVLLFYPLATHMVHPSSRYVKHYQIPMRWKFTLLSTNNHFLTSASGQTRTM